MENEDVDDDEGHAAPQTAGKRPKPSTARGKGAASRAAASSRGRTGASSGGACAGTQKDTEEDMFWPFNEEANCQKFNLEFFVQCLVKLGPRMYHNGPYRAPRDQLAVAVMRHLNLGNCARDWPRFAEMFADQLGERSFINRRAVQTVEQVISCLCVTVELWQLQTE
jgi:hypothetical protein